MRYLLDTMVWLWSVGPTERIGKKGLEILADGASEVYLSVASAWEIAIKTRLGKYDLPDVPARYIPTRLNEQGIHPLSVALSHSLAVYSLPLHHQDPFDRLIVAQAIAEDMVILTADRAFAGYPAQVIWCGK